MVVICSQRVLLIQDKGPGEFPHLNFAVAMLKLRGQKPVGGGDEGRQSGESSMDRCMGERSKVESGRGGGRQSKSKEQNTVFS